MLSTNLSRHASRAAGCALLRSSYPDHHLARIGLRRREAHYGQTTRSTPRWECFGASTIARAPRLTLEIFGYCLVRFGSKTDFDTRNHQVRIAPRSGHRQPGRLRPKSANSGSNLSFVHVVCTQRSPLSFGKTSPSQRVEQCVEILLAAVG